MRTMVEIRSALISKIKTIDALIAFHENFPVEVRELNWKGNDFKYPCVRVGQLVLTPVTDLCAAYKVEGTIMCFSEQKSSLQAEQITDIIFPALHGRSFSVDPVKFAGFRCQQFEAVPVEESDVWQSTIKFQCTAS